MTNRLDYSTTAGQVSEADTFAQLMEHLRLAEEAAAMLGHLAKAQDDNVKGQGWLAISEMFKMTQTNVLKLATLSAKGGIGWRQ
jgi:hypothetical protein